LRRKPVSRNGRSVLVVLRVKLKKREHNIPKCPEPLDTRWYTILEAVDWVLQFHEPLVEL
jgi:hypothetical protein